MMGANNPPLKLARADRSLQIRSLAALALAERGIMSPPALFKPILTTQSMSNYPWGAKGSIGVEVSAEKVFRTMGDRAAIQPLIAALDLESGIARASIVRALGDLRAKEALPRLIELFTDAKNDDGSRRGAGFRASQSEAVLRSDYAKIASLDDSRRTGSNSAPASASSAAIRCPRSRCSNRRPPSLRLR